MNTKQQKAEDLIDQAKRIIERAEAEERELYDDETTEVEGLLSRAKR